MQPPHTTSFLEYYEAIKTLEVPVPASEILLLLVVLTLCLVFKTTRAGLLLGFLFVYHWAWIVFKDELSKVHPFFMYFFFAFGAAVVVLTAVKWMLSEEE